MANTKEKFISDVNWSMLELSNEQINNIYDNINKEDYNSYDELEKEATLDEISFFDVNLISVLENFEPIIKNKELNKISIYYLKESNMYAGVYNG